MENRTESHASQNTKLRIEPLHQVHDALVGQFKISETSWAIPKIKSYFNNELNIAGQKIIIPFEGGYGKSWGELKGVI
jgi:DNA polymerase I-like protein with 3'-5' exonuclease and polymerase domains